MEENLQVEKVSEIQVIANNINAGLKAFEDRKTELTELRDKVSGLVINSIEDKAAIAEVSAARKTLKKARVAIENEGKSMRDPLTKIGKSILEKQYELIDIISPTEQELQKKEDWVKAENLKIEQEDQRKEEARIQNRIDRLAEYDCEINLVHLKGLPDEEFEKVVASAKKQFEVDQEQKAEEERQKEKDRQELEELRKQKAETDRIIKEQADKIEADRLEKENALKEEKRKEDDRMAEQQAAALKERQAEQNRRLEKLFDLGLKVDFSDNHYKGYGCFVPFIDIQTHDDKEWASLIDKITPVISAGKEIEKKAKEEADERIRKEAADKAIADKKLKEEEDARLEAERIAAASDKEKFNEVVKQLQELSIPEMKSVKHKKLSVEVSALVTKIIDHIKAKA